MQTVIERRSGNCLVSVSGRITIDSSPDLRMLLFEALGTADSDSLTLDFNGVEYVDMSGLAVLLEVLRVARRVKKPFHLVGLRDRPRYLLEATRLLRLFGDVDRDVMQ